MTYPLTAIISDLHGNRPALEVALEDCRARGVRRYVCLGDMVGYGANPRACLDAVMRLCAAAPVQAAVKARGEAQQGEPVGASAAAESAPDGSLEEGLCLKGNHEEALLFSPEDFNPKARAAIEWTRDEINRDPDRSDLYWDYLGDLDASACDDVAMYAHGSPRDPVREYVLPRDIRDREKMAALFERLERGVCFIGHSHVPAIFYEDGAYYLPKGTDGPYDLGDLVVNRAIVNVGSIGQPRDGDNRLSYVLFDGRNVTFVRLAYDHERAAADIRAIPALPDFLADRLAVGR